MDAFELIDSFDTDDGSLAGIGPSLAFALGVEWALMRTRILSGERIRDVCLLQNAGRIEAMANRYGRFAESRPLNDEWAEIVIGDYFV